MASWRRPSPTALAFGASALVVVALSVALAARPRDVPPPAPKRFPGSTTVATLPSVLPAARLAGPVRVAIVRDEAAASFYGREATLDAAVGAWRRALEAAGARVSVVPSSRLGAARGARVLVVPSSPCLTVATREAIAAAGARGQGVVATGALGTHDAGCRPVGYGVLVSLTGAARIEPLDRRDMVYATFRGGTPLATGMPPGARLGIDPARHVALRLPGRDAYYSDYSLRPLPASGMPLVDGAASRATVGGARVVHWGFELTDVARSPWNQAVAALLVRNSVAWAAGEPLAALEPWPSRYRAAAAIAQDVEDQFANVRHALDALENAGVRSTFFVTSDIARRHARLTRALDRAGEVGTHSENHRLLGGTPPDSQRARLELTQRGLTDLLGHSVQGLRPPEEQFDVATMSAWAAAGGTYLFGANDSRAAAPELLALGRDTIVMLGRVAEDDFAAPPGVGRSAEALAAVYLRGYERLRALGGLYLLSYHSQLLGRPEHVPVVVRVARTIAADSGTWLATTGEIADWWRARAAVDVRVVRSGRDGIRLTLRNRGADELRGAVVRVALPASRAVAGVSGAQRLPDDGDLPGTARLALPPLAPRATRSVSIALIAPDAR